MNNNVQTLDQLFELVENDSNTHQLRDIALLFISAMTDWPTYNQISINDFISELKEFYSFDLSIEVIDSKTIDFNIEENVWKNEAGSSISDMIALSILYYGETDFDTIIQNILNYYSTLNLPPKN